MHFAVCRQPLPVNLKKKDIKTELAQAISSAFFHESLGTTSYVMQYIPKLMSQWY